MDAPLSNAASLRPSLPWLVLAAGLLVVLVVDLAARRPSRVRSAAVTLATLALAALALFATAPTGKAVALYGGLVVRDGFGDLVLGVVLAATTLVVLFTLPASTSRALAPAGRGAAEMDALLLGATLGAGLLAASIDLLAALLSLELVSLASYVLAGYRAGDRRSSEAALKYVIYGSVASGVMIYGLSLLYGLAGATGFAALRAAADATPTGITVVLAAALVFAGIGYKVAAVPFHMWAPDVYEGAPGPLAAFLTVGPKAAGVALAARFVGLVGDGALPATLHALPSRWGAPVATTGAAAAPWTLLLAVVAAASIVLGTLGAMGQASVKRLLAWSAIAHAGFLVAAISVGGPDGATTLLLYLVAYAATNLGAFLVVAAVADAGAGEALDGWRGLGTRAPTVAAAMAVFLFSLVGMPPLAGFFGKLWIFAALVDTRSTLGAALALIGLLASAASLYPYARILRAMYLDAEAETPVARPLAVPLVQRAILLALAAATLLLGFAWSPLVRLASDAARR